MTGEYIKLEKKDKLIIIKLNNPPANSLSIPLMDQLDSAFSEIKRDEKIRVIIITGIGTFFAAGADIRELENVNSQSEGLWLSNHVVSIFNNIEAFPKPVIAAINGPCLGGGLELAISCHIRIADEKAQLGLPEIKLGLIPGGGGTQRLPLIIGFAKAYEMILTGDSIDAKEAYRIGLVNYVVPKGECLNYTESFAMKFSEKSSVAISSAIEAIQSIKQENLGKGFLKEASLFGRLCETDEKRESVKAFLQKIKVKS